MFLLVQILRRENCVVVFVRIDMIFSQKKNIIQFQVRRPNFL